MVFLKLGFTSFGGPIAHLGYFRDEFVERRKWLSDAHYADLVALCQFLPGPASSQVGIAIGLLKAGYKGAISAWLGFTMPSAIALTLFALGITTYKDFVSDGVLHGLKIVAVAIVAQALWGMAKSLCPDRSRITLMAITTCFLLIMPTILGQLLVIVIAGMIGILFFKPESMEKNLTLTMPVSQKMGAFWLLLFAFLFVTLPVITMLFPSTMLEMVNILYRTGSLVFGGGHVVLPLLQTEFVSTGMMDNDLFLAGYGATQAVPGPLFTLSAFIGAIVESGFNGWIGAMVALIAIFIPSFLMVMGVLPFWGKLQHHQRTRSALMGINAAVVGVLLAAFYQPVWVSAIFDAKDFALALIVFIALKYWNMPPWLAVVICGFMGWLFYFVEAI
ncbi:chromate efflux transporter [Ignatzschineria sp. LJL83]